MASNVSLESQKDKAKFGGQRGRRDSDRQTLSSGVSAGFGLRLCPCPALLTGVEEAAAFKSQVARVSHSGSCDLTASRHHSAHTETGPSTEQVLRISCLLDHRIMPTNVCQTLCGCGESFLCTHPECGCDSGSARFSLDRGPRSADCGV